MPNRKFGRIIPATKPHLDSKIPRFGNYLAKTLKAPPAVQSWAKSWPGIMGDNDQIGSCGPTALANIIKCQSMNATGSPIIIPTTEIVSFYSLVSGYDPSKANPVTGNNPTDTGVELSKMLALAKSEGIGGHKVEAFAAIDPQDSVHMAWASIIGCGRIIGVNLPFSAEQQADENQPWTIVPGSRIAGGHAIADYGYTATEWPGESWSDQIQMTVPWVEKYIDEAYLVITDALLAGPNHQWLGLDINALLSDSNWFANNS